MTGMNPMQMINLIKNKNPEQVAKEMIKNSNINDPMITQLVKFAETGNLDGINQIAESYFGQQGLNFGQEFNSFVSMLK